MTASSVEAHRGQNNKAKNSKDKKRSKNKDSKKRRRAPGDARVRSWALGHLAATLAASVPFTVILAWIGWSVQPESMSAIVTLALPTAMMGAWSLWWATAEYLGVKRSGLIPIRPICGHKREVFLRASVSALMVGVGAVASLGAVFPHRGDVLNLWSVLLSAIIPVAVSVLVTPLTVKAAPAPLEIANQASRNP